MAVLATFALMGAIMVAPFGLAAALSHVARQSTTLCRALREYPYTGRMVTIFFGDDVESPRLVG